MSCPHVSDIFSPAARGAWRTAYFQASVATRRYMQFRQVSSSAVRTRYKLDVPYVFYPAQFLAHKTHVFVLEGLKCLESAYGLRVGAIFSGGDQGNLEYVRKCVKKCGLSDRVRFAGFVSNEEIPDLYQQSVALVMPTYFDRQICLRSKLLSWVCRSCTPTREKCESKSVRQLC